jgi:hypothetical protein
MFVDFMFSALACQDHLNHIALSPVDGPHSPLWIAWAGGRSGRQDGVHLGELLWGKANIERTNIFL